MSENLRKVAERWNAFVSGEPMPPPQPVRLLGGEPNTCGTPAGFYRHRRRGKEPCPDCEDAHRTYQREIKRVRRGTAAEPCPVCGGRFALTATGELRLHRVEGRECAGVGRKP